MSLKYTEGKAGNIKYNGQQVTVWKYKDAYELKKEFDQLGRYLDKDSIAWVWPEFLVSRDKIIAKTTPNGNITWLDKVVELPEQFKLAKPQTLKGKRREVVAVEEAADVDVKKLWGSAVRTDWEAIMVKTSW
ncbi:MAG: hypothetical protein NC218_07240 [Acetobacter sp.]|nr:hypothetical protein [Acetobacter sp.]